MSPYALPCLLALTLAACEANEAAPTMADAAAKADAEVNLEVDAEADGDSELDAEADAEVDAEVDAEAAAPCRVDADCDIGPCGTCRVEDGTSQHDLAGKSFRLQALAVSGAVGEILEPDLRRLVAERKLNRLVYLESTSDTGYTARPGASTARQLAA